MANSTGLARLLHLRSLEEDLCRTALDSATADLHRLHAALHAAYARQRRGRESIVQITGLPADRVAGLVGSEAARRAAAHLRRRIADAEKNAAALRQAFLDKRTERRQVETLIREADGIQALDNSRREQQQLDSMFAIRRHRAHHDSSGDRVRPAPAIEEMKIRQDSYPIPEAEHRSNS